MTWSDFHVATALERDVLQRALPALPSSGQTHARATYDPTTKTHIAIGVAETVGYSPETCVERLALRPLLLGTAWKVLDLLLEEALDQAGVARDRGHEFTIALKQSQARSGSSRPSMFSAQVWAPLLATYDATVEVRHSLVHRRAYTDANGALIGVDRGGNPLRPFTADEQEAFAQTVLAATRLPLASRPDARDEARLLRHLADLSGVHGASLAAAGVPAVLPELTVVVDPDPSDPSKYVLDLPAVKAWNPFKASGDYADIVVSFRDRPGQDLRGCLEDAPDATVSLDPGAPPAWLS